MDIKPPPKRLPPQPKITSAPSAQEQPTKPSASGFVKSLRGRRRSKPLLIGCGVLLLGTILSTAAWYQWAIGARQNETHSVRVVVEPGDTAASIAMTLYEHDLIRSRLAFNLYVQLTGARTKLQAGGYVLSPNQDIPTIVNHLVSGKTDEINLTIPPGLTLNELRTQFYKDGFSDDEITDAFSASYTHPLLASRPTGGSLEGYVYPETYRMNANQTLKALLERSFDEFYKLLQDKKYLEEFQKRNLSIHEGITLASIVQKEVKNPTDQKQVAQVFLKRLGSGIQLGSDVTYMYAAKQLGVTATPSLDSPYNTRKYTGLPPGPISNMNPSAVEAVAFPAPGDYLYFVAGDDGTTYFSHTEAEHNANIVAHCKTLCQ